MFARGSRYWNVPESEAPGGRSDVAAGKQIRRISRTPGQFLHTVNDYDRLDLLAFKYYGDPTRWWKICDANPQAPFPLDLLDRGPVADERLVLVDEGNTTRFRDLLAALSAVAVVAAVSNSFATADIVARFSNPPARQQIVTAIAQKDFRLLRSFTWGTPPDIAEAFVLDDPALKSRWRIMLQDLGDVVGVVALQSDFAAASVHIVYNTAVTGRSALLTRIAQAGFSVSPLLSGQAVRSGERIIIPPNGTA